MKTLLILMALSCTVANAQNPEDFAIELEPLVIPNAPSVHSYSWGATSDHKWVIIGGRVDGLHRRQPWAAFQEQDNNKNIMVIDPVTEQVWTADLSVLPSAMFEQLQSTNQQFYQVDTMMYVTGGYGYNATALDHITYPNLTAISIDQVADAVINGGNILPFFRQITNNNLKVTGGQLGYLNGTFYLVGGHLFDGRYNPMGPTHGPGFIQEYTNEIRKFEIIDDGVNLSVTNFDITTDTANLHRRDYNMAAQIFPNGTEGFTAFSGVFNPNDLPYLNSVDIDEATYTVNNNFNQYLSQYHSAKIPVWDANASTMHTLFFGGISQFTMDAQGNLVEDTDVPFVKTISKVTRFSNGNMQEAKLNYIEMPTLVGSGAEFIPSDQYFLPREILDLNTVPQTKTLIGYIYGGIESSQENIFFINDGTQSSASNVIFKVYLNKSIAAVDETILSGDNIFKAHLYPVPATNEITLAFNTIRPENMEYKIIDLSGKVLIEEKLEIKNEGEQEFNINIANFAKGTYTLILQNGVHSSNQQFIKH
ncbi:T9SS type A sorting domain-containing protein [Crocinitomicaceae bacterium]|nr:T9SS type A sorting domain-containing protein [Crocinitomicaceae bacterium]